MPEVNNNVGEELPPLASPQILVKIKKPTKQDGERKKSRQGKRKALKFQRMENLGNFYLESDDEVEDASIDEFESAEVEEQIEERGEEGFPGLELLSLASIILSENARNVTINQPEESQDSELPSSDIQEDDHLDNPHIIELEKAKNEEINKLEREKEDRISRIDEAKEKIINFYTLKREGLISQSSLGKLNIEKEFIFKQKQYKTNLIQQKHQITEEYIDIEEKLNAEYEKSQKTREDEIKSLNLEEVEFNEEFNKDRSEIIKKIEDIRKRKINSLKEVKNQKNYLTAVLRSKKNKDKKTTNLELEIVRLQKEKDRHINSLLMLKSAFSIIDDMFIKEMENAEKYKKMTFRRWFLCGCGMIEEDNDPRKLSTFVEDVMDPYGRQDRLQKTEEAACKKMDDTFFKKLLNEFQANSKLLRDNINVTKNIYDTLEQGQLTTKAKDKEKDKPITLKKQAHIVKLFGSPREENLSVEIDELACDNDEIKSIRSDSSNSLMDIDVVCVQTQHSL